MPFEKKMHKNFETQIFNTKQHTSGQVNDSALPKNVEISFTSENKFDYLRKSY